MNQSKRITTFLGALLLAGQSLGSHAATVTYVLDHSNALPDGVDYLTVTISDDVEGQLDFWVDALSPLSDIAGDNFGIQKFAFNLTADMSGGDMHHGDEAHRGGEMYGMSGMHRNDEVHRKDGEHRPEHSREHEREHRHGDDGGIDAALSADDFILPDGWDVRFFGFGPDGFDIRLLGNGNNRQDPLHFSVLGLEFEDVIPGFSAHVAGFEYIIGECGGGEHEHGCRRITSAYFTGDRVAVIPLPAAFWLFGSGLLALAGLTRRVRRS